LAQTIAGKLRAKLSPEQKRELARQPTSDPYVYALYTQGRYYMDKRTLEDLRRAADLFQQAIGKDPRFATACAGLADTLLIITGASKTPGGLWPSDHTAVAAQLAIETL
jgi:adenylate cyclase